MNTTDPTPSPAPAPAVGPPASPAAGSRRLWLAAAGLGALAAGAGVAWQQMRPRPPAEQALARLWALAPETPSGSRMPLQSFQGRPLVLNFWATWCPPCVKEMPELDRFLAAFGPRGWQVLGLAIDQAEPVRQFLKTTPVQFPIALAGVEGLALVRDLGNPAGGLPFTVVISADGRLAQQKLGPTDLAELSGWAGG
jgi:thiol-disulfide isomerase/thioredoxin